MARTGRPKSPLTISDEERQELVLLTKRARVNRSLAFRAKIVLACGIPGYRAIRWIDSPRATHLQMRRANSG